MSGYVAWDITNLCLITMVASMRLLHGGLNECMGLLVSS